MKHDASERERRSKEGNDVGGRLEVACRHAVVACQKLLPYGFQVIASAAAYTLGISATQVVGYCLRISCATPVIGPCLGMLGVGFASTLAGHASVHARKLCEVGGNPLRLSWWQPLPVEEAVLDSVMGIVVFKGMGGRFSSLMPSDLRRPGALAFESIPAQSDEYAKPSVRRELVRLFRRDGCHHCGSKRAPVIGDHMPPNKLVYGGKGKGKAAAQAWLANNPLVSKVQQGLGLRPVAGSPQRFFPQCQACSLKQAAAVRHNKRVLVLHFHGPHRRAEHLAGIFVGLRHNAPNVPPQPPPPRSPSGSERRSNARVPPLPRWAPLGLTASLTEEASGHSDVFCDDSHHQQHAHLMPQRTSSGNIGAMGDGRGHSMIEDAKRQAQAAFERHFKQGLGV